MKNLTHRFLVAYSAVVTLAFIGTVIFGIRTLTQKRFDTIDVGRINVREADGTLRLVISNRQQFPGLIVKDKEHPHKTRTDKAGMLFFNDEGTENGGLIFNGQLKDNKPSSGLSLTFDKYEQDQVLQLIGVQNGSKDFAGLQISDRPDRSISGDLKEEATLEAMKPEDRTALMEKRSKEGHYGQARIFLGKSMDRAAHLALKDVQGRTRIMMKVAADGTPSLEYYDDSGKAQTVFRGEKELAATTNKH